MSNLCKIHGGTRWLGKIKKYMQAAGAPIVVKKILIIMMFLLLLYGIIPAESSQLVFADTYVKDLDDFIPHLLTATTSTTDKELVMHLFKGHGKSTTGDIGYTYGIYTDRYAFALNLDTGWLPIQISPQLILQMSTAQNTTTKTNTTSATTPILSELPIIPAFDYQSYKMLDSLGTFPGRIEYHINYMLYNAMSSTQTLQVTFIPVIYVQPSVDVVYKGYVVADRIVEDPDTAINYMNTVLADMDRNAYVQYITLKPHGKQEIVSEIVSNHSFVHLLTLLQRFRTYNVIPNNLGFGLYIKISNPFNIYEHTSTETLIPLYFNKEILQNKLFVPLVPMNISKTALDAHMSSASLSVTEIDKIIENLRIVKLNISTDPAFTTSRTLAYLRRCDKCSKTAYNIMYQFLKRQLLSNVSRINNDMLRYNNASFYYYPLVKQNVTIKPLWYSFYDNKGTPDIYNRDTFSTILPYEGVNYQMDNANKIGVRIKGIVYQINIIALVILLLISFLILYPAIHYIVSVFKQDNNM